MTQDQTDRPAPTADELASKIPEQAALEGLGKLGLLMGDYPSVEDYSDAAGVLLVELRNLGWTIEPPR